LHGDGGEGADHAVRERKEEGEVAGVENSLFRIGRAGPSGRRGFMTRGEAVFLRPIQKAQDGGSRERKKGGGRTLRGGKGLHGEMTGSSTRAEKEGLLENPPRDLGGKGTHSKRPFLSRS